MRVNSWSKNWARLQAASRTFSAGGGRLGLTRLRVLDAGMKYALQGERERFADQVQVVQCERAVAQLIAGYTVGDDFADDLAQLFD